MFDVTFPDGVRRGMGFDGHVKYPVVATRNGSTISERDWSRLSAKAKAKLVFDDLPESVRAPRVPSASDDAERRVGMLRHTLRGYGLDDDSVEEACEICRRELEGEADDELPTAGPGGARNLANSQSREPGEKVFRSPGRFERRPPLGTLSSGEKRSFPHEADYRSSPASDESFDRRYPGVRERIGHSYGSGQYDLPPRLSKRERKLAADAALDGAADRLVGKFGAHFAEIGVGSWPKRR
jgi:hypothetical protein